MTLSEQSVCAECEEPIDGDRYRYDPVGWLCAGCFAGLSRGRTGMASGHCRPGLRR